MSEQNDRENKDRKPMPSDREFNSLRQSIRLTLISLKADIGDDYRASDDPEDDTPGMQVTIGATAHEDGKISWSYQTGDNSYTGGAYGHPHWAVISLYRRSNCTDLAKDAIDQIGEAIAQEIL